MVNSETMPSQGMLSRYRVLLSVPSFLQCQYIWYANQFDVSECWYCLWYLSYIGIEPVCYGKAYPVSNHANPHKCTPSGLLESHARLCPLAKPDQTTLRVGILLHQPPKHFENQHSFSPSTRFLKSSKHGCL